MSDNALILSTMGEEIKKNQDSYLSNNGIKLTLCLSKQFFEVPFAKKMRKETFN